MKLKSKVLKIVGSVAYGHLTLEAMQNWKLPKVDLFIREVIQNCSDAADPIDGDYFTVALNTNSFNGRDFIELLSGFNDEIINRFSKPDSKYLEIRDTGTTGLTGPLTITQENEKDHGNYYRLVYDTGKPQTQKYSGGNWGYGKSAYYGMGAGFVIFYSQIEENGEYKSRLIVTLVEDEEADNTILSGHANGARNAGKAWWGKELNGNGSEADMLPLEDPNEINEVLSIFNIQPFGDNETGTSVIIPYVDYHSLMDNMIDDEVDGADDIKSRCSWTYPDIEGFKDYLKLSIQRWYAPAINNPDLPELIGKKWLYVTVNDEMISYDSMYPFFQLTQRLYTASLAKTLKKKERQTSWSIFYENNISQISINKYIDNSNHGNTAVGYLSTAKIPKTLMNVGEQANLNPFLLLGYYEEGESESERSIPVVMFARRLGMVIDYAYKDEWVHGVPAPEENVEYIFSFFVPYLGESKHLKPDLSVSKYAGKTLEEYLISCEASDHEGWEDHDRISIVSSIQRNVVSRIKNVIQEIKVPASTSDTDRLGNAFSKMLGVTKKKLGKSIPKGDRGAAGGSSVSKKISFNSFIKEFGGMSQSLSFEMMCKPGTSIAVVSIVLLADGSNIGSVEWESDIGSVFPVYFAEANINATEVEKDNTEEVVISTTKPTEHLLSANVSLANEKKKLEGKIVESKMLTQLRFEFDKPISRSIEIKGILVVNTSGNEYEYDLIASEETR